MLISFLKPNKDKDTNCEIRKFVDRIWIYKDLSLYCMRTFIVYVDEDSSPLHKIRMAMPLRNITEWDDLSFTLLDENYMYNNFASNAFFHLHNLSFEHNRGEITHDGFKCEINTENVIKVFNAPKNEDKFSVFEVDFKDNPIVGGKHRAIRFGFQIDKVMECIFSYTYILNLKYFDNEITKGYEYLLNSNIPVKNLYNRENNNQGGFDIFVYFLDKLVSSDFYPHTRTFSAHLPDGTNNSQKHPKLIWRGRLSYEDHDLLLPEKNKINIEGYVKDPIEMDDMRCQIDFVKKETTCLSRQSKKALWISVIAIVAAILTWLIPLEMLWSLVIQ